MMRGKKLTIWVVPIVAFGFVAPRAASALPDPARQTRITAHSGEDDTIIPPRIPRRRAQFHADFTSLHVTPSAPSGIPSAVSVGIPTVSDQPPFFLQPSSGAGVTRAGPHSRR